MRVLGVDPGLTRCGLGVVDGPVGKPVHVHHEVAGSATSMELPDRLRCVYDAAVAAIGRFEPDLLAIERVLFSKNKRTAIATGHAAGVVMLAAAQHDLAVIELTPTDVKLSVTGDGAADKDGVNRMVTAQLGLSTSPRPADAADALAVALAALARVRIGRAAAPTASSWEDLLDNGKVRVAGGTATADALRKGSR
jgi:crossover junction endodeoxyribonuclease RuvC